jgi:hypothetical protein
LLAGQAHLLTGRPAGSMCYRWVSCDMLQHLSVTSLRQCSL